MKKILEGLFIISFVFIGAQVQAVSTTGTIKPTTTTTTTTTTATNNPPPSSSLQLLSPNGGEVYKVGDVMNIKWNGCVHDQYTTEKLTIYMIDPKLKYSLNIAGDVACSNNSYIYKIPSSIVGANIGGNMYQLVISDLTGVNSFGYDQSANYFTINNSNSTYPNTSNAYVPNTSNGYNANVCATVVTTPVTSTCPNGTFEPVKDANNCMTSYKCVPTTIYPNTSNAYGSNDYNKNTCPVVVTPNSATFCPKGTIESVKDSKACVTSYKCVLTPPVGPSGFVARATSLVTRITSSLQQITSFIKQITSSLFK